MKRFLRIFLLTVLVPILLLAAAVGALYFHSQSYCVPEQPSSISNTTGLVQAQGRSLYDPAGNALQLTGINAGQLLLQEGWMSPFALEPLKHEDGSFVKDADGNLQYPEFAEEDFRGGLKSNPNLAAYDFDELLELYRTSFFTEEDFRIIKEDLGLNTIRLPFYYLNILNEDLTPKDEAEAFAYLDWFIAQAAQNELYIVLDLHGAPGSQNGYEHSGASERIAGLWDNQANMDATVALWDFVSSHYTQTAPELGKWIATYDILNEPTYGYKGVTTKECWALFDRIYDTIRANADAHVITMEGCWDFSTLPDPADYGWENVQYEYHWYNWWSNILPYDLLLAYHDMHNIGRDYDVPVLIGEFTLFEDKQAWAEQLALYDERGYSWTIWNYKTTVTGWWTSSWGVYTCQLKHDTAAEQAKCNVATCTYEEYAAACDAVRTENCVTATLYDVLMTYKSQKQP
ncbi:MAG: cellulase family glycosylhydrolase [Oscillospiraceae bacterium]|nr:cellulase family glycosylhydrolase [Oscillospiraceae bacterium]